MPGLNRKTGTVIPLGGGTGVIGRRTFAAELIQTPAFPGAFIIKSFGKLTFVIKWPAVTTVMNTLTVEHLGPTNVIQLRYGTKSQVMGQ